MNFNSFRKEINSKNASVKELVKDLLLKIDSKDSELNTYICTTKDFAISSKGKGFFLMAGRHFSKKA